MSKHGKFSKEDVVRVLDLVERAAEERSVPPSAVIDRLEQLALVENRSEARLDRLTAEFVDRMRRIRLKRNAKLDIALFRDPAWDMILELFTAHHHGRDLSVNTLCYGCGVPPSTAQRQLQRLEDHGLITRSGDISDNRRCIIRPTPAALEIVAGTVAQLIDNFLAVQHEWGVRA